MRGKHTKGPWSIEVEKEVLIRGRQEEIVASVHRESGYDDPQALVNAYLIASAPDLLAACREARETLLELSSLADDNDPQFCTGGRAYRAAGKLLRALCKAEGRTP